MKNKKEEKNTNIILKVLNSPYTIMVVLVLLVIGMMIYNRYLVKSAKLYTFTGFNDDFSITSGVIYVGYDINYFGDSKVIYTGEDAEVCNFKVGYYIKNGDDYSEIAAAEGIDDLEECASIKELITGTDFSFTETHRGAMYLSKENVNNLDNLVFRVTGEDKNGEEVNIEVELTTDKITK